MEKPYTYEIGKAELDLIVQTVVERIPKDVRWRSNWESITSALGYNESHLQSYWKRLSNEKSLKYNSSSNKGIRHEESSVRAYLKEFGYEVLLRSDLDKTITIAAQRKNLACAEHNLSRFVNQIKQKTPLTYGSENGPRPLTTAELLKEEEEILKCFDASTSDSQTILDRRSRAEKIFAQYHSVLKESKEQEEARRIAADNSFMGRAMKNLSGTYHNYIRLAEIVELKNPSLFSYG